MRQLLVFSIFILVLFESAYSETEVATTADSTQFKPQGKSGGEGELVLDEIEIKGRVEKPGVIILPKRITPEIKEVEINRSFQEEVKNGVGDVPQPEQALRRIEPVKNIKKAVEKERK